MSKTIYGSMVGGAAPMKTLILMDEAGNELTGVVVDKEVVFTANAETDIREGTIAATSEGIVTGRKVIPAYHTSHGAKVVAPKGQFTVQLSKQDCYDYTVLHGMICSYNTNLQNSVAVEQVVLYDEVFAVQSTEAIAAVTKNHNTKNIVLGITNDTNKPRIFRYITYKEI